MRKDESRNYRMKWLNQEQEIQRLKIMIQTSRELKSLTTLNYLTMLILSIPTQVYKLLQHNKSFTLRAGMKEESVEV